MMYGARTMAIVCGVLVATAAAALAAEANWPQWQGPARDNKSTETGLLRQWPEGGPKLLWKATGLGSKGFSSVAIADGLIYTTGVASPKSKDDMITALDLSGDTKWQMKNGPAFLTSHGGTRATPTIDDGLLYVLSGTGRLVCFDAKTGVEKWAVQVAEKLGAKLPTWGYAENVLIDGQNVIATPGGSKGAVVALNKKTGETIWTSDLVDGASYCSPVAIELGGVRQIVTMTAGGAVGLDAATGKLLWQRPQKVEYDMHSAVPVFLNGGLYFTSDYDGGGFKIDLALVDGKWKVTEKWEDKNLDNHHGGVLMLDGCIYGYGNTGGWVCLDFATGQVKWKTKALAKGSLTYADGMLYCYTEDNGTMALVKATPAGFEIISKFVVPKGGINEYWAHPVVCGGRLYVRHSDTLYCYDIQAAK